MFVLFTDKQGREFYVARNRETGKLFPTPVESEALHFDSAREAYDFGGDEGLLDARVGERPIPTFEAL
jgi:hypothetical protein